MASWPADAISQFVIESGCAKIGKLGSRRKNKLRIIAILQGRCGLAKKTGKAPKGWIYARRSRECLWLGSDPFGQTHKPETRSPTAGHIALSLGERFKRALYANDYSRTLDRHVRALDSIANLFLRAC